MTRWKDKICQGAGAKGTARCYENLREDRQKENRLDQDHDGDRAAQMRQDNEPKPFERWSTVHLSSFKLFAVQRLDCSQQNEGGKGQPLPRNDHNDRTQRGVLQPCHGVSPKEPPKMCKNTIHRIQDHVLPDERGHGRHDKKRRNDENADERPVPIAADPAALPRGCPTPR